MNGYLISIVVQVVGLFGHLVWPGSNFKICCLFQFRFFLCKFVQQFAAQFLSITFFNGTLVGIFVRFVCAFVGVFGGGGGRRLFFDKFCRTFFFDSFSFFWSLFWWRINYFFFWNCSEIRATNGEVINDVKQLHKSWRIWRSFLEWKSCCTNVFKGPFLCEFFCCFWPSDGDHLFLTLFWPHRIYVTDGSDRTLSVPSSVLHSVVDKDQGLQFGILVLIKRVLPIQWKRKQELKLFYWNGCHHPWFIFETNSLLLQYEILEKLVTSMVYISVITTHIL